MNQGYYCLKLIIVFFFAITLEGKTQSYFRVEYPFVGNSTTKDVYIKAITFRNTETRIDFITCYTGHYIFLEGTGKRNAMYIRIGNRKYKLRSTYGIAETDRVTLCQPGKLLEFTAIFDPIPNKERDNFDLIEGIDGTWNYYKVSISKYLAGERIPDLVAIGKRNWEKQNFKEETIEYPYVGRQSHPYIVIKKIDRLFNCTKIYLYYRTPYETLSWITFSKDTYLQTLNGEKYKILYSNGIPLSPEHYNFEYLGEGVSFCLVFPKLSSEINCFTLYEPVNDGFNFYDVKLHSDYERYLATMNNMDNFFKRKKQATTSKKQHTVKKRLKKDPNFKID